MGHYELSLFLSKIIGITFVVFAIAILSNLNIYSTIAKKISENPLLLFLVGTVDFILGILIISIHNDWVHNWTILVTLAGWILAVRGFIRLVFPRWIVRFGKRLGGSFKWLIGMGAAGLLAYGGALLYFGYLGVHAL